MIRDLIRTRQLLRLLALILLSVVLAACGSEDADETPTATSAPADAQPTVAADAETPVSTPEASDSTSAPTNIDMSSVESDASPATASPAATEAGTPVIAGASPAVTQASPDSDASPVAEGGVTGASTPSTETASDEAIPADAQLGDGTTGASMGGTPESDAASTVEASPIASPASPVPNASPAAEVTVSGCEVADVPPFTGEVTAYRLTTDLNFRTGPGAECDLALPDPIGAFQVVEVIGGPVVREDDGTEWVQIRTLDTEGWLALEFLEPVED